MNIYAVVILSALLIEFILSRTADMLNIRHIKRELPEEFQGYYDQKRYQTSQEYTKEKSRFGQIIETMDLLILLVFWFSGGFNWLDSMLRQLNLSDILTGILFVAILGAAKFIIDLPFSIYSTFVIEEKYGFNKTTWKTFILDILKGMLLSLILGVPLLTGILAIFQYLGTFAWIVGWALVTVFTLVVQYIAPRWIMPIFNKFEPLEKHELYHKIKSFFDSVDYSISGVFVMDGSRRSRKSNAFFTGFGKNKRIVFFDTLVEQHNDEEILSILAHEVGHYKKKHILKSTIISILPHGFCLLSFVHFFIASGII
ncbi:MAG: M48 family metallopeptidase [candidate division KSB1 bacterium]|nr:M48 family metallopeptidase [candidate division KSB1 bacterium]